MQNTDLLRKEEMNIVIVLLMQTRIISTFMKSLHVHSKRPQI